MPIAITPEHQDLADSVRSLVARVAPTVVARDRVLGARMATGAGAGVIVMDDGFQNPSLAKDFSVLVVDARRGIGNGRVIPAGPLRAPLAAQLGHAHALILVGTSSRVSDLVAHTRARDIPVFLARLVPDAGVIAALSVSSNCRCAGSIPVSASTARTAAVTRALSWSERSRIPRIPGPSPTPIRQFAPCWTRAPAASS